MGLEVIARYKYQLSTIKTKLDQYENEEKRFSPEILDEIFSEFKLNQRILMSEFAKKLKPIYNRYGIKKKAAQDRVEDYFDFSRINEKPYYFNLTG